MYILMIFFTLPPFYFSNFWTLFIAITNCYFIFLYDCRCHNWQSVGWKGPFSLFFLPIKHDSVIHHFLKFCNTRNWFRYLRVRYSTQFIHTQNKIICSWYKLHSLKYKAAFLRSCSNNYVVPSYMSRRISKIKCRNLSNVERPFLKDEISFYAELLMSCKSHYTLLWSSVWTILSPFDKIRFSK